MIKILLLASNPIDTPSLKLDQESRAIDQALQQSAFREQFEIKTHSAVRAMDLQGLLLRYQPHIIHFCGHGSPKNEIILMDNLNNSTPISPRALSKLFSILKDNIRCVILNACYSEAQAQAIAAHVDHVVGMSRAIGDTSAIIFAAAFYQALGYGRDIQSAFELGCLQIDIENLEEFDIPKLLSIISDPSKTRLLVDEKETNFGSSKNATSDLQIDGESESLLDSSINYESQNESLPDEVFTSLEDNQTATANQDRNFSEHLRTQWLQVNKAIDTLTNDQYRIIHWLRGHKRAAISGCAGSGKTLIAVEKAVRLDRAGLQTLILCHSPNLASYIRRMTISTGILVYDFGSWIAQLIGKNTDEFLLSWNNYFEPLDEELEQAFDCLSESYMKMDAVIVDEAQDFKDTWWLIVQAALADEANGILYLFYDDNQALLPYRAKYPITTAPFPLEKNCRNAGQVYDFVRRFHPHAPDTSNFLAHQGVTKLSVFEVGEELSVVHLAIQDTLRQFGHEQIVILSTETGSIEQSVLHTLESKEKTSWRWQDAVIEYLSLALRHYKGRGFTSKALPTGMPKLSEEDEPTQADIRAVVAFARRISDAQGNSAKNRIDYRPETDRNRWFVRNDKLMLRKFLNAAALLAFFQSESWADDIPRPKKFTVFDAQRPKDENLLNVIPLYSVSSFKGLEADAVILFVRAWNEQLERRLYVGSSRARLYLHLVVNYEIVPKMPKIKLRVN